MSDRLPSSTSLRGALVRIAAPLAVLCVVWLSLPADGSAAQPSLKVSYPAATVAGRPMTVTAIIKRAPKGKVTARLERRVGKKWTAVSKVAVSAQRTLSLKFTPSASLSSVTLRVAVLRGRHVIVTSAAKTLKLGQAPRPGGSAGVTGQGPVLPAPGGTAPPAPSPRPSNPAQPLAPGSRPVAVPAATAVTEAPVPGDAGELHLSGATNLQPGDYLAVGVGPATPDGFLGQVKSVRTAGGETIVTTEPAALTDVVPEGDIDETITSADESSDQARTRPAPRASASPSCGGSAKLTLPNPKITLSKSINFQAHWSLLHGLETASLTGQVTAKASINASVSGSVHCSLPSTSIAEFKGSPITFQVGPVPVVLTPNAKVTVDASADAAAALSTGMSAQATATAGIKYVKGDGASPVASFSPSWNYTPPTMTGTAGLSANVVPTINVLVYGVAGPQLAFKTGLELDADIAANPWWTLTAPVDLTAQLVVPALKLSTDKLHVFKKTYTLAKATGPFTGTGSDTPALNTVVPIDNGARLTWTPPRPRDGITATQVLVQARSAGSDDNSWSNDDYLRAAPPGSSENGTYTTSSPGYINVVRTPGTEYRIIYIYGNAGLQSQPSNIVATDPVPPPGATLKTVTPIDNGARLTWTPPPALDGIEPTQVLVQARSAGSDDNSWSNDDYLRAAPPGSSENGTYTTSSPGYINVVRTPGTEYRIIYIYGNAGLQSQPSNIVIKSG